MSAYLPSSLLALLFVLSCGITPATSETLDLPLGTAGSAQVGQSSSEEGVFGTPESSARPRLQYGFRAGPLLADIDFADDLGPSESVGWLFSWQAGIDISHRISESLEFASGLHYLRKGATGESKGPIVLLGFPFDADLETTLTFHYLVIPARLRASSPSEGMKPFASGGFDLGLLTSGKAKIEGTLVDEDGVTSRLDSDSDIRSAQDVELALALGVGVEFPVGARSGIVELSGTYGLTDNSEQGDVGKNRTVGLAVGVRL